MAISPDQRCKSAMANDYFLLSNEQLYAQNSLGLLSAGHSDVKGGLPVDASSPGTRLCLSTQVVTVCREVCVGNNTEDSRPATRWKAGFAV